MHAVVFLVIVNSVACFLQHGGGQHSNSLLGGRLYAVDGDREVPGNSKLQTWLEEAQDFGVMRFVVQGSGVILEAIGQVANIRCSVNPKTGGELITISEGDGFESHFRVEQINKITYNEVEKSGKKLRINRFIAEDGKTNLLSLILHIPEGEDATERITAWDASRARFGGEIVLV